MESLDTGLADALMTINRRKEELEREYDSNRWLIDKLQRELQALINIV